MAATVPSFPFNQEDHLNKDKVITQHKNHHWTTMYRSWPPDCSTQQVEFCPLDCAYLIPGNGCVLVEIVYTLGWQSVNMVEWAASSLVWETGVLASWYSSCQNSDRVCRMQWSVCLQKNFKQLTSTTKVSCIYPLIIKWYEWYMVINCFKNNQPYKSSSLS